MNISSAGSSSVQQNTDTAQGVIMAKKAQSQTEIEGQMALKLIQSATSAITEPSTSPVGNIGSIVNIQV